MRKPPSGAGPHGQDAGAGIPDTGNPDARSEDGARLEAAALDYLARFAAPAAQLRRVLLRRLRRWTPKGSEFDPGEAEAMIAATIARLEEQGLLDDAKFAEAKAAGLRRRGNSLRAVRARLRQKGVAASIVEDAIAASHEEGGDFDLHAAASLLRRRRLGCYRPAGSRETFLRKDLAALARAGFSEPVARKVLSCADPAALETLIREAG